MKKYLAWTLNISPESNLIIDAPDFNIAKQILTSKIKLDTMFQEVHLMELDTLQTKTYFIEKT
jgi:hypothetical protein